MLYYTLGYVTQLHARHDEEDRVDLLRSAAYAYMEALRNAPGEMHDPTTRNLALVYAELGAANITRREVAELLWVDPGHATLYRGMLGDHFRLEGKIDEARVEYQLALQDVRADPSPLERLTKLTESGDSAATELLEALTPGVEDRFPEIAGEAYRALIHATYSRDSTRARTALARWIDLRAQQRSLNDSSLAELPADWRDPQLEALRAFARSPDQLPNPQNGWMSTSANRNALARAGLAFGLLRIEDGAHEQAESYWRAARNLADPRSAVAFDLARELASLYFQRPRLDPDKSKFSDLERELFSATMDNTLSGDALVAQQRLYATLGLIYAGRRIWSGGAEPRRSANYQLERAISVASMRERRERIYQPLPTIRARYAEGLAATGDTARAKNSYLAAARAYLDVDDVNGALEMLGRVAGGDTLPAVLAVRQLLTRRFGDDGPACDSVPAAAVSEMIAVPDAEVASSIEGFVRRQRFRLLADCAARTSDTLSARYAADAVALALWGVPGGMLFADASDLLRFDLVKDMVRQRFGLRPRGVVVTTDQPSDSSTVPTIAVNEKPLYFVLDRGSVLAARLGSVLPASLGSSRVRIERRGVVLSGDPQDPFLAEIAAKVRLMPGVTELRFEKVSMDNVPTS
jgi:hypothetical protein